jgi:hypothetical protein
MSAQRQLVQRIDGKAAEKLGVKVSGFLRHHIPGEGHFAQLLHGNGIGEERHICFSAANVFNSLSGIAQIAQVGLLAHFFGVEAEQAVERDGVQLGEIKLALALGNRRERDGYGVGLGDEEERTGTGDGNECGS